MIKPLQQVTSHHVAILAITLISVFFTLGCNEEELQTQDQIYEAGHSDGFCDGLQALANAYRVQRGESCNSIQDNARCRFWHNANIVMNDAAAQGCEYDYDKKTFVLIDPYQKPSDR